MSNYTSMSARNSNDDSTDDTTQTDFTQIASYHEKKDDVELEEASMPLSKRNTGLAARIVACWKSLIGG